MVKSPQPFHHFLTQDVWDVLTFQGGHQPSKEWWWFITTQKKENYFYCTKGKKEGEGEEEAILENHV